MYAGNLTIEEILAMNTDRYQCLSDYFGISIKRISWEISIDFLFPKINNWDEYVLQMKKSGCSKVLILGNKGFTERVELLVHTLDDTLDDITPRKMRKGKD